MSHTHRKKTKHQTRLNQVRKLLRCESMMPIGLWILQLVDLGCLLVPQLVRRCDHLCPLLWQLDHTCPLLWQLAMGPPQRLILSQLWSPPELCEHSSNSLCWTQFRSNSASSYQLGKSCFKTNKQNEVTKLRRTFKLFHENGNDRMTSGSGPIAPIIRS